jgi:prepilin-type N-terminal cleavage/methylation domain-containing protein
MKKGFTLVELLVVITILAVLAGAAIPFVQAYVEESRLAKCKADLEEISRALVVYETREGEYPDSDVKLLAGRYLNKSPIDAWGSPYMVDRLAGTVFSKGPDRKDKNDAGGNANDADNIVVAYQPPLALVSAKWVDRNQNGVLDSDNVPDQLLLTFSRKIDMTSDDCIAANINKWLFISYDGDPAKATSVQMARYVQAFNETAQTYLSTPDILTSSKDVLVSLQSPYDIAATTKAVLGKAFLVINDPKGNVSGVADGDEIKDIVGNLSLSSQKVIIIPQ